MSTRAAGSTFLLVPRFHTLKRSVLVSVACSLPCQLCREVHQRGCILFQPCRCNHHSKPLQFVCSTPMRCGLFELIEMHALHPLTGQAPHQFDARAHTPPNHFACTCMLPCFWMHWLHAGQLRCLSGDSTKCGDVALLATSLHHLASWLWCLGACSACHLREGWK